MKIKVKKNHADGCSFSSFTNGSLIFKVCLQSCRVFYEERRLLFVIKTCFGSQESEATNRNHVYAQRDDILYKSR